MQLLAIMKPTKDRDALLDSPALDMNHGKRLLDAKRSTVSLFLVTFRTQSDPPPPVQYPHGKKTTLLLVLPVHGTE